MTDVFSVSSLEEYIKIVERFSPNFSLSRGQGSDLPLFPSALRRDQDGMRLYSKTTIQSFLEDFKFNSQMYIEGASTYHENDWLIHAQHFGVPTCLLDFTYSHLVSLMFALEKAFDYDQDDEDNAVVWLLDPEALNLKTIGRKEIINLSEEAIDSVRRFEHPFVVINTDFVKKMEQIGIHCRVFNPFMPGLNVFLNNRDHRKITVIDGKVAFTGGYNLANEYFNYTHPYGQWKDTGIRLEGDAVQSLTATFLEMWNAANDRNNNEDFSKYFIRSEYKAAQTGFAQPYADSPMDDEQVGEEVYISMVNKAEKYCWFITPYLIITDEMTHALCLAAKRGIDVRIITPGIPDKKMIYSVTRSFYHGLVKNGVRIYEWTPGFCHAKMSVADDCMATCGTINLDYRSLYHHFENGCFMADSPAVLSIRNDLEETMKECREVTEQYRTGRSAYLRLGQLFMRLFAGLL